MKFEAMDQEILDFYDESLSFKNGNLTIRKACIEAVLNSGITAQTKEDEKIERYSLALKLKKEEEPELTLEEIVETKKHVGTMWNPLVVGRVKDYFKDETGSE